MDISDLRHSQDTTTTQITPAEPDDHKAQKYTTQVQVDQDQRAHITPVENQIQIAPKRNTRTRKAPVWLKEFVSLNIHQEEPYSLEKYLTYDTLAPKYQEYIANSSTTTELSTYSEAMKNPRQVEVMKTEI